MKDTKSYYCENCGSVMEFDVNTQSLKCPNCENEIKIQNYKEKIIEHELTMRAINSIKVEEKHSTSMECEGCGAIVEVDETSTATTCPYCGSNYVLTKKQLDSIIPDGVVPFKIDKKDVGKIFHNWIKGRWLAPNTLKNLYQSDKIQGIYIPFWTFDADVRASYKAMGGEDYEITTTDEDGEEETEIETNWYPTYGNVSNFFDDVLVKASDKLDEKLLDSLIYNTQNISSFSPDYMSGYCSEIYTIDLNVAYEQAIDKMEEDMRYLCERDVLKTYDRVKDLSVSCIYKDETYKYILVPVYSTAYLYKDKKYHVLINGQSGKIEGQYPKSTYKIAAIVIFVMIIVVFILYYINA